MKFQSTSLWASASLCVVATLTLAGCGGANKAARRTALDCPPTQGALKLASVSPDAHTCAYADTDGDEVSLRLLPVVGSPQATLQPIERELQALVPPARPEAGATATAAATADDDGDGDGDRADITLPGVRIQAAGDKAHVRVGSLHVDAGGAGAVIREARDTRLQGEQLSTQRRGYRATYIVARSDLPDGLTSVGYEAGGPKAGPLTVAVLKMKSSRGGERIHRDVRRLVRRNGGI